MAIPLIALGLAGAAGAGTLIGAGLSAGSPREKSTKSVSTNQPTERGTTATSQGANLDENGNALMMSDNFQQLPQPAFKPTNVAWLDEKLANGTATAYDAYLAKNFLGMNLGDYGRQSVDVNLNGKLAMTNLNKLYDNANNVIANADLYDAVLASGKDNIGWVGEMSRDWYEFMPALSWISPENNKYRNLQNAMAWAAAIDATNGGKPNRFTQEHFMNMYQHTSRGEKQQASLMAGALKQNNIALKKNIEQIAQLRGGLQNVPQAYIERYNKNLEMIKDLSADNFDYSAFLKKYKLNADDSYQRYLNGSTIRTDENGDTAPINPLTRE